MQQPLLTAQLVYGLLCDDVRLEAGNKLSLMGVFENIFFPAFPSVLLKFAVVTHWEGNGHFETQVKVLKPDGREMVVSAPSRFSIETQGYADNITFFTNLAFETPGAYVVQILLDGRPIAQRPIYVHQVTPAPGPAGSSTTVH
jgi:hypothetical protein